MKFEVSLRPEDSARLGCPEKMVLDFDELSINDLIDVQRATGLNGHTISAQVFAYNALATKAVVWMALRSAGVNVTFEELTYKLLPNQIDLVDAEFDEEGKGESSTDTPSEKTTT